MSSCPLPQNTSHRNSNRPVRSGTMRTRVTSPDLRSARTPSSGILKPWSRSSAVISKMTGKPFFRVISFGVYSNLFAVMCTTCSAPGGTAAVAKRCQPAAIPTAAKTTRAVTVMIRFIAQLFSTGHSVSARSSPPAFSWTERKPSPRYGVRRGQRKHEPLGGVVRDVPGHLMVLLMDVPVEDGHVLVGHERLDRRRAVARRPVPVGSEVEERAVGEHDDRRFLVVLPEVGAEPLDLVVAQLAGRVGDVVDHDEVHALVIERVMRLAEELLERLGPIERGI